MVASREALMLRTLFENKYPRVFEFGEDEFFADTGAITSFQQLGLVLEIEKLFSITVPDEDFDEENIGSYAKILEYVARRLAEKA